jgi:hypothetical protein
VLTERIIGSLDRHIGNSASPWTPQTQALIDRYAPRSPEEEAQAHELGLVGVTSLLTILVGLLWVAAGALTSSNASVHHLASSVGIGAVAGCLLGVALHATRFYVASLRVSRSRRGEGAQSKDSIGAHHWPQKSSDLDFICMAGFAVLVAAVVA